MNNEIELNFYEYVLLQYTGEYNMITDINEILEAMLISKEEYVYILDNYNKLKEQYPTTWELAKNMGTKYRKFMEGKSE